MSIEQAQRHVVETHRYVQAELRHEQATQAVRVRDQGGFSQDRIAQAQKRIDTLVAAEAALRTARAAFE